MAINNLSDLIRFSTLGDGVSPFGYSGRHFFWTDPSQRIQGGTTVAPTPTANKWISLRQFNNTYPGHGNIPSSTAEECNGGTQGAWPIPSTSGNAYWLVSAGACATTVGEFLIYDRIAHIGGFDATVTGRQEVAIDLSTMREIPGDTNRETLEIWVEIYTQIGATARTLNIFCTDSTDATFTVSTTIGGTGSRDATAMLSTNFKRQAVTGLKTISELELLVGSTGTGGNYGLTVVKPIARIPAQTNIWNYISFTRGIDPQQQIDSNAHLAWAFESVAASAANFQGFMHIVEEMP